MTHTRKGGGGYASSKPSVRTPETGPSLCPVMTRGCRLKPPAYRVEPSGCGCPFAVVRVAPERPVHLDLCFLHETRGRRPAAGQAMRHHTHAIRSAGLEGVFFFLQSLHVSFIVRLTEPVKHQRRSQTWRPSCSTSTSSRRLYIGRKTSLARGDSSFRYWYGYEV